jgi:hypothetical protein
MQKIAPARKSQSGDLAYPNGITVAAQRSNHTSFTQQTLYNNN